MRQKQVRGFQTGDMVKAILPTVKKAGTHTDRVAVRKTGSLNIQTEQGAIQDISHQYCTLVQRGGYGYSLTPTMDYASTNQRRSGGKWWRNPCRSASDALSLPALEVPGISHKI